MSNRHTAENGAFALREWAEAMTEHLGNYPDHDLTAEDVVSNALARAEVLELRVVEPSGGVEA